MCKISEIFDINFVVILIFIFCLLYYYGTYTHKCFKNLGVKYLKPIPFFGNTIKSTLSQRNIFLCYHEAYKKSEGENFFGFFRNRIPELMIRDPQLVQTILVTDFSHFYNRGRNIDPRTDPLRAYNLVNLTGPKWKWLRQKLTPAFSSGKLKMMFQQFTNCGDELIKYVKKLSDNNESAEIFETMSKLTIDVIGSCAFGLHCNSLQDPDSEFRKVCSEIFRTTFGNKVKKIVEAIHVKLPVLLNMRFCKREHELFFINLVKDTMQYREENKIERNDFVQILMNLIKQDLINAKNNELKQENGVSKEDSGSSMLLDDEVLAANTFVFFFAGFDTSASTLSFCLFELSLNHNRNIQNKLREEILTTVKNDNDITYDTVKDMVYMERVVSETLRKYPVAATLVRECTKPYKIPDSEVELKKGTKIIIPVYSIHHDQQYYPEPDLFDPERFNEENVKKRPSCTYLPFGEGPRACIGSRFALLEMKATLTKLLLHYEIMLDDKTKLPLQWKPYTLLLSSKNPIYFKFKPFKV